MALPRVVETILDLTGVMTLDGLMRYADRRAVEDQDMRGMCRILWFMVEGNKLWVMETPWEGTTERQSHLSYIAMLLEAHPTISAYATAKEAMIGKPPQRCLILYAYERRSHEFRSKVYAVDKDENGKPSRRRLHESVHPKALNLFLKPAMR